MRRARIHQGCSRPQRVQGVCNNKLIPDCLSCITSLCRRDAICALWETAMRGFNDVHHEINDNGTCAKTHRVRPSSRHTCNSFCPFWIIILCAALRRRLVCIHYTTVIIVICLNVRSADKCSCSSTVGLNSSDRCGESKG